MPHKAEQMEFPGAKACELSMLVHLHWFDVYGD